MFWLGNGKAIKLRKLIHFKVVDEKGIERGFLQVEMS
tara:strand:- start:666 stop:776 length:111 start_codon:yes stop_codon:yes gene_type:complete